MTAPRLEILRIAWNSPEHFTADEMHQWVLEEDASASRATVYRTLALLAEGDFLSTMNDGRGTVLYERYLDDEGHHDHMICIKTGKIIEFTCQEIEDLQDEIAKEKGYEIVKHIHQLFVKPIK